MSKVIAAPERTTPIAETTIEEFLRLLKDRQIEVQAREGRLKINAPAGAVDAALRAELKARKVALLGVLGTTEAGADKGMVRGMVALSAVASQGKTPLTSAQQGMWLIDHFNPGDVAYNISEAFRLDGEMDLPTIQAAVDRLMSRHSILRTSFHEADGELFQWTAATVEARVGYTDLSSLPEAESDRRCREAMRVEGRRAFDLKQAPLVQFHLFQLSDRRHVLFFYIHHIIADRTSLYILREDLVAFSKAIQDGTDAVLPALRFQFPDYAAWVAEQMQSGPIEGQIAYWKRKLEGLPAFIELPHSWPRPEERSPLGATRRVLVAEEARAAMERIGTEERASPFMTFLALFAVSVARWSQESVAGAVDFCIGSPITHRRDAATERMVGLFVNMLAFRCQVQPGMSFRDVVRQVRGTALEAYENSDVPFQRLVREMNPDRRSRRSPIFQVMFGYERYVAPAADEFHMDADPGAVRYDLSLHLWETADGGLLGGIEYCADLFGAEDIDRLGMHGDALLNEIVRDPDQQVFGANVSSETPTEEGSPVRFEMEGSRSEAAPKMAAKGGLFTRTAQMLSSLIFGRSTREGVSIALED